MTGKQDLSWGLRQAVPLTALLLIVAGCSPPAATNSPTSPNSATTVAHAQENSQSGQEEADATIATDTTAEALPRLLDLGAGKCIPCKMMAPILDEMKEQYAAQLQVDFIDVWENPDEAKKYGVETIPTQIFFDASGNEKFRHVGFFSKEEILAKWKELGVTLQE